MEIGRIFGLPAHPLFVHAVVVLVPLCAIGVVLCAFWSAARRRLSITVLLLSVFTTAMVPIVQASGEWLEDQVGRSPLLERHTQLGDDFLPYAIALVIGAGAVAALRFMEARSEGETGCKRRRLSGCPNPTSPALDGHWCGRCCAAHFHGGWIPDL